jgi:hypothetical protein
MLVKADVRWHVRFGYQPWVWAAIPVTAVAIALAPGAAAAIGSALRALQPVAGSPARL